jgi:hypothetical protein
MRSLHMPGLLGAILLLLSSALDGAAAPPAAPLEPLDHAICRLIENAADTHHLPVSFVTRLIWRESSFRARAVSPAGALGIAQFMPQTAIERGLADPFDPEQAIPQAARFLADLRRQFGSLGVAAAAYYAGPARVASWRRGDGDLPAATQAYVRFVTEPGAARSSSPAVSAEHDELALSEPPPNPAPGEGCLAVTAELRRSHGPWADDDGGEFLPSAPWGVQLAGNFSKALALASYERARIRYAAVLGDEPPMIIGRRLRSRGTRRFYQVRLPAESRAGAEALCGRIRSVGGVCVALRS